MALSQGFIETTRLVLSPLRVDDAGEMVRVLEDPDLYLFTGGEPPTFEQLVFRYKAQTRGSQQAGEEWFNWIIRLKDSGTAVGFTQATIVAGQADLAWVVSSDWQRRGYASEASRAVFEWVLSAGADTVWRSTGGEP